MGFLKRKRLGILGLCLLGIVGCIATHQGINPDWNITTARERLEAHPLPEIFIVYNDYQVGYVHNKGNKFSDKAFKVYVFNLAIAQRCKEIRFFYGINRHGQKRIGYAVIYI
jgi:hypothetical protein